MSMIEWAKNEIQLACEKELGNKNPDELDYGCACYKSAYKAFQSLVSDGHSGYSIGITKAILNRLIDGKPLTPIEDTLDVWDKVNMSREYDTYQCKRMSSLFKDVYKDGTVKYRDINRFTCVYKDVVDSPCWYNGFIDKILNEKYPIVMPYSPPTKSFVVYCTEGLSDTKNGDFDTIGIWYIIKPNGEKDTIERFFKEGKDNWAEIDIEEYEERVKC